MQAIALLGGPSENWPSDLEKIIKKAKQAGDLIIASDRGSLFLKRWQITPDVAVGDFDSLKAKEKVAALRGISDLRYSQPVKDYTDSEQLFITALVDYRVDNLVVYGATGGRLDHFMVNVFTFLKPELRRYLSKVEIIDKQNILRLYGPGKHEIKFKKGYRYIGFGNLEEVKNFTIRKARYELENFSSTYPTFFSSNEFVNEKSFWIYSQAGVVLAIYSKDIQRFS